MNEAKILLNNPTESQMLVADTNIDGALNVLDIITLINMIFYSSN